MLRGLAEASSFRRWFTTQLIASGPPAFRWETPALSSRSVDAPFECVLVDDPRLERSPEPRAFSAYFEGTHALEDVRCVPNLGGTSELIVPHGIAAPQTYVHLAGFLRGAPAPQIDALWRCVAETALRNLSEEPLWLSTAGAGVAWLHVRVDRTPKYYWHRPYAQTR